MKKLKNLINYYSDIKELLLTLSLVGVMGIVIFQFIK